MEQKQSSSSFTLSILASPARTWQSLTREVDAFWPDDMLTLGPTAQPALEPQIGGRLYEYRPDGAGALLATIIEILPETSLSLQTTAAPHAVSLVTITLGPTALAGTSLTLTLTGGSADSLGWWRRLLESGLKPYLEAPRTA